MFLVYSNIRNKLLNVELGIPGEPKLSAEGPANAAPAEKPDDTPLDADVGVRRPPPTVELNPMNADDMAGEEVLPRVNCARAELLPRMLPIPLKINVLRNFTKLSKNCRYSFP